MPNFSDEDADSQGRIASRHVFEAKIQILIGRNGKKLSLLGWARDLSEGGLSAFAAETLAMNETVTLEVPLLGSSKQVIPAKVVRALGTEYGFRFTALSAEQRRLILATLQEYPTIPFDANRRTL